MQGPALDWAPSPEVVAAWEAGDPYPLYAECRANAPIRRLGPDDPEATSVGLLSIAAGRECYLLFGARHISALKRDQANVSAGIYGETMTWGRTILEMDEPEHTLYRALVQPAFQQRTLVAWYDRVVPPLIDRLVDGFLDRGRADLVADLTGRFPFEVIAALLGIPAGDHDQFRSGRWRS